MGVVVSDVVRDVVCVEVGVVVVVGEVVPVVVRVVVVVGVVVRVVVMVDMWQPANEPSSYDANACTNKSNGNAVHCISVLYRCDTRNVECNARRSI